MKLFFFYIFFRALWTKYWCWSKVRWLWNLRKKVALSNLWYTIITTRVPNDYIWHLWHYKHVHTFSWFSILFRYMYRFYSIICLWWASDNKLAQNTPLSIHFLPVNTRWACILNVMQKPTSTSTCASNDGYQPRYPFVL